jgi:hypothetical protein
MVHVSRDKKKEVQQREGVEFFFFQHIKRIKLTTFMCLTYSVALCKTECFGEYHTKIKITEQDT